MPSEATRPRAWPLLATAAVVDLLGLSGVLPPHPDLVRAVALPPFDLTFDLGVLLGRATGPGWFATGLLVSIVTRSTILSLVLGSPRKWWFALRFELVVLVPSFVAAELAYVGQAVLYSAAFWIGLVVSVASALVFAHLPWRGSHSVWSSLKRGFLEGPRIPLIAFYAVALGVLGALTRGEGEAVSLTAVWVSALLTLLCARRLSRPPAAQWATRLVGLVAAVCIGAFLVAGPTRAPLYLERRSGELLLVPGMDTSSGHGSLFSLRPSDYGYDCAQTFYFSYAGSGPGAPRGQSVCPIKAGAPYTRADTERPLEELVRAFRAQADRLAPPVTVVTHSSGAWVALAATFGDRSSPVRDIVMVAPITDPHGYPQQGRGGGGVVGADAMRLIVAIAKSSGFSRFDPDGPLASQLLASKRTSSALFELPLPRGVRALVIPSAYDLALTSTSRPFGRVPSACAPAISHGALPTSTPAAAEADRFLSGRPQEHCTSWASWIAHAAATFQVP